MRCTHCNAIIPEGWMRCPRCGKEVQIVPDYNPLDDVLTQEVKGSVEDVTRQLQTKDVRDLAEDRKCTSQKQRGCSVRKSWMKYRPGESVRRETDPVQRRNENSRNEKSSWFAEDGSAFDPVSGPVDFWSGVRLFSVSEFLCGKSGKRVRCTADERI